MDAGVMYSYYVLGSYRNVPSVGGSPYLVCITIQT